MYALVKIIGMPLGPAKQWEFIPDSFMSLRQLMQNYQSIWLQLNPPNLTDFVYLNLNSVASEVSGLDMQVSQWLASKQNTALPTQLAYPLDSVGYAKYMDGNTAGYLITASNSAYVIDNRMPIQNRPDGLITGNGRVVAYNYFRANALISVNGFYLPTQTDGVNGVLVKDAFRHILKARQQRFGIYSFVELGGVQIIPITQAMISEPSPGAGLVQKFNIDIGQNVDEKMPLLVIGGYLHTLQDRLFERNGSTGITIDWRNSQIKEKIFESRQWMDLSDLGVACASSGPIVDSVVNSDDFIRTYLTQPYSFIAVVNKRAFVNHVRLQRISNYGESYRSLTRPIYPVRDGYGRTPEYHSAQENGQYDVRIGSNVLTHRIFQDGSAAVAAGIESLNNPYRVGDAYFLEIGCGDIRQEPGIAPPPTTPPAPPPVADPYAGYVVYDLFNGSTVLENHAPNVGDVWNNFYKASYFNPSDPDRDQKGIVMLETGSCHYDVGSVASDGPFDAFYWNEQPLPSADYRVTCIFDITSADLDQKQISAIGRLSNPTNGAAFGYVIASLRFEANQNKTTAQSEFVAYVKLGWSGATPVEVGPIDLATSVGAHTLRLDVIGSDCLAWWDSRKISRNSLPANTTPGYPGNSVAGFAGFTLPADPQIRLNRLSVQPLTLLDTSAFQVPWLYPVYSRFIAAANTDVANYLPESGGKWLSSYATAHANNPVYNMVHYAIDSQVLHRSDVGGTDQDSLLYSSDVLSSQNCRITAKVKLDSSLPATSFALLLMARYTQVDAYTFDGFGVKVFMGADPSNISIAAGALLDTNSTLLDLLAIPNQVDGEHLVELYVCNYWVALVWDGVLILKQSAPGIGGNAPIEPGHVAIGLKEQASQSWYGRIGVAQLYAEPITMLDIDALT